MVMIHVAVTPDEIGWKRRRDLGPKVWETPDGGFYQFAPEMPEAMILNYDPSKKKNNGQMEAISEPVGHPDDEAAGATFRGCGLDYIWFDDTLPEPFDPALECGDPGRRGSGRDGSDGNSIPASDEGMAKGRQ